MRYLLDTHVFLWWVEDNSRLGPQARKAINEAREIYVSLASAWEFLIKKALGKIDFGPDADFEEAVQLSDRVIVFTRDSGNIKTVVSVDLPWPRDNSVCSRPEFMAAVDAITKAIL